MQNLKLEDFDAWVRSLPEDVTFCEKDVPRSQCCPIAKWFDVLEPTEKHGVGTMIWWTYIRDRDGNLLNKTRQSKTALDRWIKDFIRVFDNLSIDSDPRFRTRVDAIHALDFLKATDGIGIVQAQIAQLKDQK